MKDGLLCPNGQKGQFGQDTVSTNFNKLALARRPTRSWLAPRASPRPTPPMVPVVACTVARADLVLFISLPTLHDPCDMSDQQQDLHALMIQTNYIMFASLIIAGIRLYDWAIKTHHEVSALLTRDVAIQTNVWTQDATTQTNVSTSLEVLKQRRRHSLRIITRRNLHER